MEKKRAEVIADRLEAEILDGLHPDGARLDEIRLAERFRVSRTPIREALGRLAQSGLVEQLPRRGVFVRQPGPVDLMEMFEVMAELEAACAQFAAARISDADLALTEAANAACGKAAEAGKIDLYYIENERFHQLIYRNSGNGFLERECLRLQRRLRPFRRRQLRLRGRLAQSLREHADVLHALRAADADRAGEAMRAHVAVQGEKFHLLMSSLRAAE